ncbi:MAG: hypothetical protein PHI19_06500, partial [Clostridia bacterium]|nr:hypothetical protein [Clostridia bacterium]
AGENLGDESQVIKYHFKAVNNEDGTTPAYYNGNKSVASTTSYTSCKLDRLNPELSVEVQYQNGDLYSGDWTNGDITFVFTASYGGSGAQINFSNNSTVYENTGATPGYNTGDANIIIENDVFYWTITTEQKSIPYYFKITTGTNKDFTIVNAVTLKIDKTKPVISEPLLNKSPNSNGWIGQETDASFTVSEGEGWSGIVGISVSPSIPLSINSGAAVEKVTNSCILKINDYEQYTITAIDVAGNVQTRTVRYKIDSKTPVLSVEEGSYIENIWVNTSADFNLLVQLGASGAKFFYSYGDDNYFLIGDDVFLYEGDGEAAQQEVRTVFSLSQEMNRNLKFKVETGSNKVAILDFGVVKLDYTPPTIASITDMSYYQNDWRDNPIAVEFYARDDASDIDLSNVTVNNDATVSENGMTIEGFRKFQFEIIKCTVYTVTVYDIAGNAQTYDFWAKIDTVTPSMDYEAYVGSTAEEYYFDKWLNRSTYGDDAYVRFVFYMQISASGAKIQYKDSSEIWKDLTGFLFEEGNESGLIQNVVCEVDVVTEQNGPYMIRLMTGSGKTTPIQDLGTVMIDSTLPYFTAEPVFTDAEDSNTVIEDFQTDWTYKVVKARFIPFDQTSGINSVNVSWYDIDDPGLTNGTPVICQKEADTNYYSFLMDTYAYYELELADGSGNIYRYPVIEAMVDTTDGYSLAVTATKGGEPYISGDWLKSEDDAVDFIFDITFDGASGYTAFGPSGGGVEFSVDDGDTWVTSLDLFDGVQTLVPDPNDPLKASMTVVLQQNNTYRFRVVSGAGRVTTVSEDYLIRKDIVLPEIDYTVMVQGTAYDSSWTAADVLFLFTISVGASNGVIQQTISATEIVDLEDPNLVWTDIIEVTQGYGTTHSYTLENTVDSLYYYFRLVAGTSSKDDASEGKLVRIDKEVITPTFEIYKGEEVFTDDWSDIALTAVLTTLPEIVSGYEVYYAVKEVGETPLESDYEVVTLGAGEENYQTQRTSSERKEIRFRVVNGAGVKFDTSPKIYGIDLITPEFEITFNGEAPKEVNPENPPAVWYLDDVNVLYTVNSNCISGTTNQYAVLQDGVWSGWTSSGIDGDTLILEDTSESGGSIIDIKFRVISGSGRFTQQEYIAHIDDNQYEVNLVQYVGSVEGLSYAEYVNGVTDSKRNGSVNISFKEADGYRLKAVYVGNAYFAQTAMQTEADETNYSGAYEYDYSLLSLGGAEETVSITVGGSNVEVYLYFIKDIVLEYGNLEQYMQNNTVQEIDIWVDEYGFDTNYASENLTFEVSYNGEPVVPNAIGVYDVVVSTENPNFNVVNGDYYTVGENNIELQLILRYFIGAGDVFDSYMISNYEDLTYISSYMNTSSDFNYLGEARWNSFFRLNNDIELPSNFTPLCETANNAFQGELYGQNHKIYYDGTYTVYSDFGLFIHVTGGLINNLGVEYSINAQIQEEADISLLIAKGTEATVFLCYAYGDITINGGEVNCGGLIGNMTLGMMLGCFADVHLNIKNSVGNFGGIVGNMYIDETAIAIMAYTYSVSQIAIDNSDIHATRTTDYYVGAYLGYLNLPFSEESIQDCIEKMVSPNNYYLNNSVFNKESGSDGVEEIVIDIGIGNENVASDYSIYLDYRSFIESDTYFGAEDLPIIDGLYVGALARMRIQDAGFGDNEGTEASPFSITDYSKLDYIKVFPWAYFKQTADIILPDDYAALATLVP